MKKAAWTAAVLSFIITAAAIQFMPDSVALHCGADGTVDLYGSKYMFFAISVMILLITAFFGYIMHRAAIKAADDKERAGTASNNKVMGTAAVCVAAALDIILIAALYNAIALSGGGLMYLEIDEFKITSVLIGLMFIILGNMLPKTRTNGDIGLRVTWTMYNENTWRKSNRAAGIALMIAGVVTLITSALLSGILTIVMMMLYLTAVVIFSLVYAHRVYTDEKKAG